MKIIVPLRRNLTGMRMRMGTEQIQNGYQTDTER